MSMCNHSFDVLGYISWLTSLFSYHMAIDTGISVLLLVFIRINTSAFGNTRCAFGNKDISKCTSKNNLPNGHSAL